MEHIFASADLSCAVPDERTQNSLYDTTLFTGEAARYAALESLKMLDTAPEEPFQRVMQALVKLFNVPTATVSLVADPSRVWFKAVHGYHLSCVDRDGAVMVPATPEILITEDASRDARFAHNPYVAGPPHLKFYAGTPLVGSRGERYGTLCICDLVQRAFTAEMYSLLNNFAALVVEELERNKPLYQKVLDGYTNDVENNRHLDLSLMAITEGVVMVDVRDSSWPVVYFNPAFEASCGLSAEELSQSSFWDVFEWTGKTKLDVSVMIRGKKTFELRLVCKLSNRWLTLRFIPAVSDRLAPSKATGIPGWVPSEDAADAKLGLDVDKDKVVRVAKRDKHLVSDAKCFWFAMVFNGSAFISDNSLRTASKSSTSTTCSETDTFEESESLSTSSSFFGEYGIPKELGRVRCGPLLGSGSFGKVYRGLFGEHLPVAIKVIDCRGRSQGATSSQQQEAELSYGLDHPAIVKILQYGTSLEIGNDGKVLSVLWMVQELCDLGTLTDAAHRGWLRVERSITARADMQVLRSSLREIARGMEYLHCHSIIHADLTGRNVLLCTSQTSSHGFVAKVCDFGLSSLTKDPVTPLQTQIMGTVTHMPPELLTKMHLLPAGDVWAFSVIGWEAYHGKCCYCGKNAAQIVMTVARGKTLDWPSDAPEAFVSLMKSCMSFEHSDRPAFPEVAERLGFRLQV